MNTPRDLARQLARAMSIVVAVVLLMTFIGFYLVYMTLAFAFPERFGEYGSILPDSVDVMTLAAIALPCMGFASVVSFGLARRIARPLHSVASAAGRIAGGDLTARAEEEPLPLGETALLVSNFNAMAERLEGMASDLVVWNAQIAHELRTPLTILKGRLQGMADGVFPMDAEVMTSLLKHVDGLGRLVEDLRAVSLSDGNQLQMLWSEVELADELRDLAATVAPGLRQAGFDIVLDLAPGRAIVDVARLRQALLALVNNAKVHANPCTIAITLSYDQGEAILRVADEGPGMAPEFAARAFRPFARGAAETTGSGRGSGLGLAVVHAVVKAHGGTVTYANAPAASAFSLRFPIGPRLP